MLKNIWIGVRYAVVLAALIALAEYVVMTAALMIVWMQIPPMSAAGAWLTIICSLGLLGMIVCSVIRTVKKYISVAYNKTEK